MARGEVCSAQRQRVTTKEKQGNLFVWVCVFMKTKVKEHKDSEGAQRFTSSQRPYPGVARILRSVRVCAWVCKGGGKEKTTTPTQIGKQARQKISGINK